MRDQLYDNAEASLREPLEFARGLVAALSSAELPTPVSVKKAGQSMTALSSAGKEAQGFQPSASCPSVEVEINLGKVSFLGVSGELRGTILTAPSPKQHPEARQIQEIHERWALRVGLWHEDQLAALRALDLSSLWTDCLAQYPAETASIIPDYSAMFIILDDTAERFIGQRGLSGYGLLKQAFSIFYQVLEGRYRGAGDAPSMQYPKYIETCTALLDLRERIVRLASEKQYERFLEGMRGYFRGVLQQVYLSGRKLATSRETQIYNRELNVAFRPTVALMAIITGLDLSDDVLEHPMFERVMLAICRLGGIINDIISFQKEVSGNAWLGQYHNLIAAEFNESSRNEKFGNLLERAISKVFEFHNNEMHDFFLYGSAIADEIPEFQEYRALCAAMHRSWMNWCLRVERYSHAFSQVPAVVEHPSLQAVPRARVSRSPSEALLQSRGSLHELSVREP